MVKHIWQKYRSMAYLPLTGLAAFLWVVIRVSQKPTRAQYPCIQAASPLALGFLACIGITGTGWLSHRFSKRSSFTLFSVFFLAFGLISCSLAPMAGPVLVDAPNAPIGEARGIYPGRVVWAYEPSVVSWNGSGYWWDETSVCPEGTATMLSLSLQQLTGTTSDDQAWQELFAHFNLEQGRDVLEYQPGEKVAIKFNMNNSRQYSWDGSTGLNHTPQLVLTLLRQLVHEAGVAPEDIVLTDPSRWIGDPIFYAVRNEFPQVRMVDQEGGQGREKAEADLSVPIFFADETVLDSGATYLPKVLVEAQYLINLSLLKGHGLAGITLGAKNHFGSIWRPSQAERNNRGWMPDMLHRYIAVEQWQNYPGREMATYNPMVDLMGHEHLDGKAILFIIDGLYAAPFQGGMQARWQSEPFEGDWTASLFVSQDPVAVESVAADFMRNEPTLAGNVAGTTMNYLYEAALAGNPPSGVVYDPEGNGVPLASLGVQEHWNNPADKQYSRNLGIGDGIELLQVPEARP